MTPKTKDCLSALDIHQSIWEHTHTHTHVTETDTTRSSVIWCLPSHPFNSCLSINRALYQWWRGDIVSGEFKLLQCNEFEFLWGPCWCNNYTKTCLIRSERRLQRVQEIWLGKCLLLRSQTIRDQRSTDTKLNVAAKRAINTAANRPTPIS